MNIKDIAKPILEAASLCGYASSMPVSWSSPCGDITFAHTQWQKGLMEHVESTRQAIDEFWKTAPLKPEDTQCYYNKAKVMRTDYRSVLLDLVASMTLCENMSDVCCDVQSAMDRIGIDCDVDLSEGSTGPFRKMLHNLGAKTLNGTEIWSNDEEGEVDDD